MTITAEIIDDINILLENSEIQIDNLVTFDDGMSIMPTNLIDGIYDDADEARLTQSQAVSISKIYFQQSKSSQIEIKSYLLSNLDRSIEMTNTIISVYFLVGAMDELIDHIITKYNTFEDEKSARVLMRLNQIIHYFWENFSKSEVKKIQAWAKEASNFTSTLGKVLKLSSTSPYVNLSIRVFGLITNQTNIILTRDVNRRIEMGFNPEINEDEAKIKDEILKFGFPADLSEALDKIDQKFNASKDDFDFKGTMDLLRSFTERLYRSILNQYGDEGRRIRDQDSKKVSSFFVEKGLVNEDFGNMITHQRHFISNTASHRLKSREEDARLSKNMVIEMSLYILRRLHNH